MDTLRHLTYRPAAMLFYEPLFLFAFFPAVFAIYLFLRRFARGALGWIALASCGFYLWSEPLFFWIALLSAAFDFWLGGRIASGRPGPWLALGIFTNIGILVIFKYSGFLVGEAANPALAWFGAAALPIPSLALPVGISFIVFEKITYLVDIHRGISRPATTIGKYLFYVFFFPKLLAGPIIKYHEIEPQIAAKPALRADDVADGFERFAIGMSKKLLIADPASTIVDKIYSMPLDQVGTGDAWIGAIFFSVQIYFDFSGYSDMAIGLARMLGFSLRENFNFPYTSVGITEFWRRWHISLSSWIREYLYIPLGGSRVPVWRGYTNLVIAFLASGIWHGASWTFVIWGIYHGVFLVLERAFLAGWLKRIPVWLGIALTAFVVINGWVLFRAISLDHAIGMFQRMYVLHPLDYTYVPTAILAQTLLAFGFALTARLWLPGATAIANAEWPRLALRILVLVLFALSVGRALAVPFQPFLYFRF